MIIKRLHELSKAELEAVSGFLRGEIQPASITEGSDWVCQKLQRSHFWGIKGVTNMAELDKMGNSTCVVGFDGVPIALCRVGLGEPAQILLFIVTGGFEVAYEIALASLDTFDAEVLESLFPEKGWAGDFARRCGFKSERLGNPTSIIPDPNPMLLWTIRVDELRKNIEGNRGRSNV